MWSVVPISTVHVNIIYKYVWVFFLDILISKRFKNRAVFIRAYVYLALKIQIRIVNTRRTNNTD